jgi:hypothetical protein
MLFHYIRHPHQVFCHIRQALLVSLMYDTPILSPCQVKLAPSPVTSPLKKEQNQRIALTDCIYNPHITLHSQLTVRGLFPNMFRLSLADLAKQNKLVKIFLWTPHIWLQDAMILAKYSNEEIEDKAFCRSLQRTLPGSSLKGLKAHIARVVPSPPDRTQGCQKWAIKHTPPLVNHRQSHGTCTCHWNCILFSNATSTVT